jgi:hypothetical protein
MYNAIAGSCAEQKANSASSFDLSQFASVAPVGINYNMTQDAPGGTNIITGIGVTASNFYISNTGGGGTYDSGTEEIRKLAINNPDGLVSQVDDISGLGFNQIRDIHIDKTGQYIIGAGWVDQRPRAGGYATAEDITSTLTSRGDISSPLGAGIQAVAWNSDGTKAVMATATSSTNNRIRSYTCNTAYSLSSVTSIATKNITDASTNGVITGVKFNDDGTKIFVSQNKAIREYVLSTPYDVSTMGSVNYTLDLSTYIGDRILGPVYTSSGVAESINGFDWSADGRTIFVTTAFGGTQGISGSPSPPVVLEGRDAPAPTPNTFPIFSLTY